MAKTRLLALLKQIPDPPNYHDGYSPPELSLPEAINMFPRPRGSRQFYHEPKTHLFRYVLILAFGGTGCIALDNELVALQNNAALLIFPGQTHYYVNLHVQPFHWFFITFRLEQAGPLLGLRNTAVLMDMAARRLTGELVRLYRRAPATPAARGILSFSLWQLLLHLAERQSQGCLPKAGVDISHQSDYDFLSKIQRHIESKLTAPLTVASLAAAVGTSRSVLHERFKKLLGTTVAAYVRRHRLKHADHLLATTDFSITQIAERCGFGSVYNFCRVFRRVRGITPRCYRQRLAGHHAGQA